MQLRSFSSQQVQATSSKIAAKDKNASGSSSDDDGSAFQTDQSTPPKRTKTISLIPAKQKKKLQELDGARCLISFETKPSIAIQACHIVRKTAEDKVKEYEVKWGLGQFDIDTTKNLVSLRGDWYAAFNDNCWAFVPTQSVLNKMLTYARKKTATFEKPYRGYNSMTDYIFIPLSTLDRKFITQANFELDDFNTYWINEKKQFPGFPTLKHHAHPYFVIESALPKLLAHIQDLTPDQLLLLADMKSINIIWQDILAAKKSTSQPRGQKRRRDDSDESSEDSSPSKPQSKQRQRLKRGGDSAGKAKGKGKGKEKQNKAGNQALLSPYLSPPLSAGHALLNIPKNHTHHYDRRANVSLWIDAVASAGVPEKVSRTIIRDTKEIVRSPFKGDWHNWCFPWTQPPDHSKFSSNDWAMQENLCSLTRAPLRWESVDYSSSSEDDVCSS